MDEAVASVSVEVAGQGDVGGVAEEEADVGDPLSVRVPEVGECVGDPEQPWGVHPVTVPITHERLITRISVGECE